MKRYKNLNTQLKLAKSLKAVIFACLITLIAITLTACSATAPTTTVAKITTTQISTTSAPTTTVEQTTTTQEATTTTEAIINAPEIAGLKFDQATKTYLAEAGNPYGLEAGVEAGVYIKNAFEFEGENKDSIGLKAEIVEFMQKKLYKETKEYLCPIIFPLNEIKGIEIEEMVVDTKIGEGFSFLGLKVPPKTQFQIPASGNWIFFPGNDQSPTKTLVFKYDIGVQNDEGGIEMDFKGEQIIENMKKGGMAVTEDTSGKKTEIVVGDDILKLGEIFGVIADDSHLEMFNNELGYIKFKEPDLYQFGLVLYGKNDSPLKGMDKLLSIGDDKEMKVFIYNPQLPNDEKYKQNF